jgi:hypothetical protein
MRKSYRITLLNDAGGPSNNLVGTAEADGKNISLSITDKWQYLLPEHSEDYNSLIQSILNGAQTHSMRGYEDSGMLNNAWRFYIDEVGV